MALQNPTGDILIPTNDRIVFSSAEPSVKYDGLYWYENGIYRDFEPWRWDSLLGKWLSQPFTWNASYPLAAIATGQSIAPGFAVPAFFSDVYVHRYFYSYQVATAWSSSVYVACTPQWIRNTGAVTNLSLVDTRGFTNNTTVYRNSFSAGYYLTNCFLLRFLMSKVSNPSELYGSTTFVMSYVKP